MTADRLGMHGRGRPRSIILIVQQRANGVFGSNALDSTHNSEHVNSCLIMKLGNRWQVRPVPSTQYLTRREETGQLSVIHSADWLACFCFPPVSKDMSLIPDDSDAIKQEDEETADALEDAYSTPAAAATAAAAAAAAAEADLPPHTQALAQFLNQHHAHQQQQAMAAHAGLGVPGSPLSPIAVPADVPPPPFVRCAWTRNEMLADNRPVNWLFKQYETVSEMRGLKMILPRVINLVSHDGVDDFGGWVS